MAEISEFLEAENAIIAAKDAAADAAAGAGENSFAAVAAADAEYRAVEAAKGVDEQQEAEALRSLFVGASARACEAACASVLKGAWTFATMRDAYRRDADASDLVGARVRAVVEGLEAPHLRPSSIEERLLAGTNAAAYGLASLFTNLSLLPP